MTNGEKLKAVLNPRANQIRILGNWVEIEIQKLGINFSCGLDWWNTEYKEPTTKNDLSSGLENVSPIIDWNKCHTSEQLNSIATTKNDLGVDAISRQALYDALYERFHEEDTNNITNVTLGSVRNFVKNFPSVTPQEPKTGHWKYFQNEKGDWMNVCSNCNSDCGVGYPYNYCPNCGADMSEVVEE